MPSSDSVAISPPAQKAKVGEISKDKDKDAQTQPVQIIASLQAQVVRHLQPALLLSLFLARFGALVADPVSAMSSSLPVVAAIQVTYAVVCLPAVGSHVAKPVKKARPGEKKKVGLENTGPNIAVVCSRSP